MCVCYSFLFLAMVSLYNMDSNPELAFNTSQYPHHLSYNHGNMYDSSMQTSSNGGGAGGGGNGGGGGGSSLNWMMNPHPSQTHLMMSHHLQVPPSQYSNGMNGPHSNSSKDEPLSPSVVISWCDTNDIIICTNTKFSSIMTIKS